MPEVNVEQDDNTSRRNTREEEKHHLEQQKLALEIVELAKPWWKKPTSYFAGLPTLLAIAGLIYGIVNGYFSSERSKLEVKRERLELDIATFTAKKDTLNRSVIGLQEQVFSLESSIDLLSREKNGLKDSLSGESQLKEEAESALRRTNQEILLKQDSVKSLLQDERKLMTRVAQLKQREFDLSEQVANLGSQLALDVASDIVRGLPSITMAVAHHLKEKGNEQVYIRGKSLGSMKGVVILFDFDFQTQNKYRGTYLADSTVTVDWNDSLVVLSATHAETPFFQIIAKRLQSKEGALSVLVRTGDNRLSRICQLELRE